MRRRWLLGWLIVGLLLAGCGEAPATVQVVSLSPSEGVQVILSGEAGRWEGRTPWELSLPPGHYFYAAFFPDRKNRSGSFTLSAGETLRLEIPALELLYGKLRVSSNATAQVRVDGVEVGTAGPNPAQAAIFGPFPLGEHLVSATTPLGEEGRRVRVVEVYEAPVDFRWGSRLVVVLSPTLVPSLTVTVDGRPYTAPVDFAPGFPPSVEVEASAPGYTSWREKVALRAGEVVTASVVLLPGEGALEVGSSTPAGDGEEVARVLAAYRRFREVEAEAFRTLDGSHLPEVMTGTLLDNWQSGLEAARTLKAEGTITEIPVHTPTITLTSDITAQVRVAVVAREKTLSGELKRTYHEDGIYTFRKGADGIWRMAAWQYLGPPEAVIIPTPRAGGGGGGGVARPAPADRELVKRIMLASINCTRQAAGWEPVVWDQELADAFQPIVEEMGAYYSTHLFNEAHYDETFWPRISALLYAAGAIKLDEGGTPLSLVPSLARGGGFAYDWENYADRPCETGWAHPDWWTQEWMRPVRRVAIVLSTPYWDGVWWEAWELIVGRP